MHKIHTTLRLFFEAGLSIRATARSLRVSPEVPAKAGMGDSVRRAKVAGLGWPLPEGMDERALEARLFPDAGVPAPARRAMPDWAHVHTELRRKGGALSLLWQEYKAEHLDGIQYTRLLQCAVQGAIPWRVRIPPGSRCSGRSQSERSMEATTGTEALR